MSDDVVEPEQQAKNRDAALFRRMLRNSASNYLSAVFNLFFGFLVTPFLLHRLGPTEFGLWMLIMSSTAYGTLFDFGLNGALTKYVSQYRVTGETRQLHRYIAASSILYWSIGAFVAVLGFVIAPYFPSVFNIGNADQDMAVRVASLAMAWVGLSIACTTPVAILQGLQRYDLTSMFDITSGFIRTVGVVVIVLLGGGIQSMILVYIVVTLLMRSVTFWVLLRLAPELRFRWSDVDRGSIRGLLGFSSQIFIGQVAKRLQRQTDLMVVGAIMSVVAVTPYAVAWRLSEIARRLSSQVQNVILPMASELNAEGDQQRLRTLYLTSVRVSFAIATPVALVFAGLAAPFLTIWVGAEYAEYSHLVVILMIAAVVSLGLGPTTSIMIGMGRYRLLAISSLVSGIANLALSIVLGKMFGLTGVALGTLIPTVIESLFFIIPYTVRLLKIPLREVFRHVVVPSLVPAVPALLSLYLLEQAIGAQSLIEVVFIATISGIVYASGYLVIGASEIERSAYRNFARNTWRFAGARLKRA